LPNKEDLKTNPTLTSSPLNKNITLKLKMLKTLSEQLEKCKLMELLFMIPQCQEDINFRVSEAKLLLPKLSQHQRPLQLKLMLPQKREQHQNKKNHK